MSVVASVAPSVLPSVAPAVVVVKTTTGHVFEVAQIAVLVGSGVGASIVHSLVERGKWSSAVNYAVLFAYSAVLGAISLYVNGLLDLSNWFVAFQLVLAAASTWYATLFLINKAQGVGPVAPVDTLPTVTQA